MDVSVSSSSDEMSGFLVDADIDIENQLETPIVTAGQYSRISVCFTPDGSSCSVYPSPKFDDEMAPKAKFAEFLKSPKFLDSK
jgi:hypothetical protein